jgi:pectinesterase
MGKTAEISGAQPVCPGPHIYVTPDDRLQKIFDEAAPGSVIHLSPGVYRQKTVIRTPDLTVVGAGADKSRIVFDDYARKRMPDGFEYITFRSYTLAVCAENIRMENLSVINDAGSPEVKGQQIALTVYATGFEMKNCRLSSTQDTLFLGPLPPDLTERYEGFLPDELRLGGNMTQRFENCLIEGTVDFIFGCGDTLFDRCEIRSLGDNRGIGYIAAPAHSREQDRGLVFSRCDLTCAEEVSPGSVWLARPWRDYGLCSFENCTCGAHIAAEGFINWPGTGRDKTARFHETPPRPGRVTWANREREEA